MNAGKSDKKIVYKIIKALREENKKAHGQIYRLVEYCGAEYDIREQVGF